MIGKIENEKAVKTLVANGLIPSIEREIERYKTADNQYLYGTALEIGELVDAYHKIFQTGNSVDCVKPTINVEERGKNSDRENSKVDWV